MYKHSNLTESSEISLYFFLGGEWISAQFIEVSFMTFYKIDFRKLKRHYIPTKQVGSVFFEYEQTEQRIDREQRLNIETNICLN